MIFYVQQVYIDKATRRHEVILDVARMQDHVGLEAFLGAPARRDAPELEAGASMLRFSYLPDGSRGLKEGSWYDIDPDFFEGARYEAIGPDAPGGSLLRGALHGLEGELDFTDFLTGPRIATPPAVTAELVVEPEPKGGIELTVVDCGHGNWNEIGTASDRILYDVGASRVYDASQIRAVVASRKIASEKRPITVVISHWDVDHYHALLQFTAPELTKLRAVFLPSQLPDTETFRRVYDRLNANKVPMVTLPPATRPTASRQIDLVPYMKKGVFTLFRATPGRSRNQTGIALGVRGGSKVALLTGDHHYNKLITAANRIAAYKGQACVLVAPHHGGPAGTLSTSAWTSYFSSLETPLSCGANSFDHPLPDMVTGLTSMQAGSPPKRTDHDGTITHVL